MEIKKGQEGQSIIEFLLTFTIVCGMLFFYFRMSLGFTNGYMVHYATFMASRSYLTADSRDSTNPDGKALQKAQTVFKRLLPDGLITNFNGVLKANEADVVQFKIFTGVYADFSEKFSLGIVGSSTPIALRSESFLGREPTRLETTDQTCEAIKRAARGNSCGVLVTLDDNGG